MPKDRDRQASPSPPGGQNPFAPSGNGGDSLAPAPGTAPSSIRFSLRSLLVLISVCAVLASLIASLVRGDNSATNVGTVDPSSLASFTASCLVLLGPLVGLLLYGRKLGMLLGLIIAVPIGALVGAVAVFSSKASALQIPITLGASVCLIVFTLLLVPRRHNETGPPR